MKSDLMIGFLKDRTEFSQELAELWHQEWGDIADVSDSARKLMSVKSKSNDDRIPFILIATINDELVGSVSVFEKDLDNRPELGPWLAAVITKPKYRGRKIAEKLTESAILVCKEFGYKRIYLRTEKADGYFKTLGWKLLESTSDEKNQPTRIFVYDS